MVNGFPHRAGYDMQSKTSVNRDIHHTAGDLPISAFASSVRQTPRGVNAIARARELETSLSIGRWGWGNRDKPVVGRSSPQSG
jgi:hypothetical protein